MMNTPRHPTEVRVPGGHTYVEAQGRIRVLDGDGYRTPAVYLHTGEAIDAGTGIILAPLVDEQSQPCGSTPISTHEMLVIAYRYGMVVETTEQGRFMVVEAEAER